jgi:glycosyltransferase involved in cell wall biosynthesis/peptidoglycan/xylan/chitin deacetylase (PgdA/CDA1 family)
VSRKPHICHVVNGFDPAGSEIRTAIVMNGLGAEFRHTMVSRRDAFQCVGMLSPEVEVDCVSFAHRARGKSTALYLGRLLRGLDPDLICVYNWPTVEAAIGSLLFRLRPWIAILDGFGADEAKTELTRRRLARRFLYRRSNGVVCVSRGLERLARTSWKVDPRRIVRIPNGIDTDTFRPAPPAVDVRGQFGIPADAPLVGTVAHLRPEKDPVRLLRAFAAVAADFPRAHLMYVGTIWRDGLRNQMHEEIEATGLGDRVHFTGPVSSALEHYRAFDVFALASRTEQMPMSVAEAMACGKPVVSTDVGDVRAMVAPENRPFVVPLVDDAAYVDALRRLLAEPETRRSLGEANRETAVRELDRDGMVAGYRSLFRRLVDPAPEPRPSLAGRAKSFVRKAGSAALYYTGLLDVLARCRRRARDDRATILAFHCVSESGRPERRYFRGGMNVDAHEFRALLETMRRRYRLVSLDEAVAGIEAEAPRRGKPALAITFDDGYRSVHDVAFPILQELDVPATVFLPTDYIGTGRLLWWDELRWLVEAAPERVLPLLRDCVPEGAPDPADRAVSHVKYLEPADREALLARLREAAGPLPAPDRLMMTWDEVRTLHRAGVSFGSHTVGHYYLDALDRATLRYELKEARARIEEEIGVAPLALAYPDGRFDDTVIEEARGAGYRCAVTTMSGSNAAGTDLFRLRRLDGGMPVAGQGGRPSFPVMWAEILGVWDALFLRRRRTPERFSTYRPVVASSDADPARSAESTGSNVRAAP